MFKKQRVHKKVKWRKDDNKQSINAVPVKRDAHRVLFVFVVAAVPATVTNIPPIYQPRPGSTDNREIYVLGTYRKPACLVLRSQTHIPSPQREPSIPHTFSSMV